MQRVVGKMEEIKMHKCKFEKSEGSDEIDCLFLHRKISASIYSAIKPAKYKYHVI